MLCETSTFNVRLQKLTVPQLFQRKRQVELEVVQLLGKQTAVCSRNEQECQKKAVLCKADFYVHCEAAGMLTCFKPSQPSVQALSQTGSQCSDTQLAVPIIPTFFRSKLILHTCSLTLSACALIFTVVQCSFPYNSSQVINVAVHLMSYFIVMQVNSHTCSCTDYRCRQNPLTV